MDSTEVNWLESDLQAHIVEWLREEKALGRLAFAVGMEGVRLSPGLRAKAKKQGMDKGIPDLTIKIADGKTVHIELKRKGNYLQGSQKAEGYVLLDEK